MNEREKDPRTPAIRALMDAEHFRYTRFDAGPASADEVAFDSGALLLVEGPSTPLLEQAVSDFRRFCSQCMCVTLEGPRFNAPTTRGPLAVRLRLDKSAPCPGDLLDPAMESFTLHVDEDGVRLEAAHERGLLHGTHYVERLMADRGAPYLRRVRKSVRPRFMPRLTNGIFVPAAQKVTDLALFSDDYLSLMSHFGANGIHVYLRLWDYIRNDALPELNSPDYDERIRQINDATERLARHGLDLYLVINNYPARSPDDPLFRAHPRRRGAYRRVFEGEQLRHVPCSSSEEMLQCYDETFENLFRDAPGLAGMWMTVGGEGFLHCFCSPHGVPAGETNCPWCKGRDASEAVAALCNRVGAAVKRTGRYKTVWAHPYSAFVWSAKDAAQLRWMEHLSPDVYVYSAMDVNGPDPTNDSGVTLFDYNIKSIGPTERFKAQAAKSKERGLPILGKTETNTTPDAFFLPYIPVHYRWQQRFVEMSKLNVCGFVGQWRFFGMNGSLPEELQYHVNWNPAVSADDLLRRVVRRDFALSGESAEKVLRAWHAMSEAWDDFPYSAMLSGERGLYMRGPLHLGPAHPLIFNPQDSYDLSPKFREMSALLVEASQGKPAEYDELLRKARPRYVSELLLTVPFGVELFLELISRCHARWSLALADLKAALGAEPTARAQMEMDVCETIDIHLAAIENTVRFYAARDRLSQGPLGREAFGEAIEHLKAIVRAEIANAERALPIMARDRRIGYIYCYGNAYDEDMVRDKLRQCRHVLEQELPHFDWLLRFHLWNSCT